MRRLLLPALALALAAPTTAQQSVSDSTAFLNAVRDRDGATATRLLESSGATVVGARNGEGDTALHIATRRRDAGWIGFLLARGANPNLPTRDGEPPLVTAARLGFVDGVQLLLRARANVDGANRRGETPLIVAVQARSLPVVQLLLGGGANPAKTDSAAGYSALDYARQDRRSAAILRALETGRPTASAPSSPSPSRIASSARAPVPTRGTLAGLVRMDDYPEAARVKREQGTAVVRLGIGINGRVEQCTVTQSSGSSILDASTCRILRSRARYEPARDASGNPGVGEAVGQISWRLSEVTASP